MFSRSSLLAAVVCASLACHLAAQNAFKPLTNDDVVAMVKGGLDESTIVNAVQSQDTSFDISATALLQLKKGGVTPKLMDAMLAAAAKHKSAEDYSRANAAAITALAFTPGQPSVAIVQGSSKQTLLTGHTQIVQTKTKASSLSALASDGALGQALTGVAQGLATAGMMHPGSGMGTGAMMTMPMVGPALMATSLLGHRKPTVTDVWALPGQKSETPIHQNQPLFEVQFANVPGVNPDDYEPVLLKLEPTNNNFRLVGATQAKQDELQTSAQDWGMYSTFVEEREGVDAKKLSSGNYQLQPAVPLAAGQYGIALRPKSKDKKFSGSSVSQNTGDGLVFNSVWAFEIRE